MMQSFEQIQISLKLLSFLYYISYIVLSDPVRRSVYDAVRANSLSRELTGPAERALVAYGRPLLATELDRLFARLRREDLEDKLNQATRPQVFPFFDYFI